MNGKELVPVPGYVYLYHPASLLQKENWAGTIKADIKMAYLYTNCCKAHRLKIKDCRIYLGKSKTQM